MPYFLRSSLLSYIKYIKKTCNYLSKTQKTSSLKENRSKLHEQKLNNKTSQKSMWIIYIIKQKKTKHGWIKIQQHLDKSKLQISSFCCTFHACFLPFQLTFLWFYFFSSFTTLKIKPKRGLFLIVYTNVYDLFFNIIKKIISIQNFLNIKWNLINNSIPFSNGMKKSFSSLL